MNLYEGKTIDENGTHDRRINDKNIQSYETINVIHYPIWNKNNNKKLNSWFYSPLRVRAWSHFHLSADGIERSSC